MKKSRFARLLCCVMSAILFVSLIIVFPSSVSRTSAATYTDAKVQTYEASIAKIENQIKAKKAELEKISAEQSDMEAQASLIEEEIALTKQKISETENLLAELAVQIETKNFEINEKSADIDQQRERFKNRVRVAYEEGDVSYLEMILGSEDMSDFLSRLEYINSMIEYDNRLMKEYQNQKTALEGEKQQLEAAQTLQQEYKTNLENEKAGLLNKESEVDNIRANLREQYAEKWKEHSALQAQEDQISAELEKYIKEMQAKNQKHYVGGEFIWPTEPRFNKVSSEFGGRWLWGYWDNHYGIDIPCALNSEIYASNGGVVLKAEFHPSYGNYIIIDHGGGKSTLYAHNNSLAVSAGDEVSQGQVIAYAGTTGSSSGYHCHFEYRVNGARQNPRLIVSEP